MFHLSSQNQVSPIENTPCCFGNTLRLSTPAVYLVFRGKRHNRARTKYNGASRAEHADNDDKSPSRRRSSLGAGGIIVNPAARHKSLVNIQARVNDSLAAIRHIFQKCCGGMQSATFAINTCNAY